MYNTTVYPLEPEVFVDEERTWDASLADELPPMDPFPFFDLPPELRIRIYGLILKVPKTIDLDRTNPTTITPRLLLFRVSRQMYEEAYRFFYSQNTFRLFATIPPFYGGKYHILMRLKPHQRACITSLELRLGPGFSRPPKSWSIINSKLGLKDCRELRSLKVFVELDPMGIEVFKEWRMADDGFTIYCRNMLHKLLEKVPTFESIEFDAWPSVKKGGRLMTALLAEAAVANKPIGFGPDRGWSHSDEPEEEEVEFIKEVSDDNQVLVVGDMLGGLNLTPTPVTLIHA